MRKMRTPFIVLILLVAGFIYSTENYRTENTFKVPASQKSRLTIHFFSSPFGISWDSPQSLLLSNILNYASPYNRKMGHVAAEVHCVNSDQKTTYYNFTGMTDRGKDVYDKLIVKKLGFGVVFTDFPGALEEIGHLQNELKEKQGSGRVHSLTYQISEANCLNLANFIKEYKKEGVDKTYGGLNYEVRYKKRAGCVHFVYSLVDIANLETDPFMENWIREILIPQSLIGGPVTGNEVGIIDMLTDKNFQKWSKPDEAHHKIAFWDIDSIFNYLKNETRIPKRKLLIHGRSKEFIIDRTDIEDFETDYWIKPDLR